MSGIYVIGASMPSKTVPMSGVIQSPGDGIYAGSGLWRVRYVGMEQDEFEREPEKISEGGVFFSTKEFKNEDADEYNFGINFRVGSGVLDDGLQLAGDNAYPSGSYRRSCEGGLCGPIGT